MALTFPPPSFLSRCFRFPFSPCVSRITPPGLVSSPRSPSRMLISVLLSFSCLSANISQKGSCDIPVAHSALVPPTDFLSFIPIRPYHPFFAFFGPMTSQFSTLSLIVGNATFFVQDPFAYFLSPQTPAIPERSAYFPILASLRAPSLLSVFASKTFGGGHFPFCPPSLLYLPPPPLHPALSLCWLHLWVLH